MYSTERPEMPQYINKDQKSLTSCKWTCMVQHSRSNREKRSVEKVYHVCSCSILEHDIGPRAMTIWIGSDSGEVILIVGCIFQVVERQTWDYFRIIRRLTAFSTDIWMENWNIRFFSVCNSNRGQYSGEIYIHERDGTTQFHHAWLFLIHKGNLEKSWAADGLGLGNRNPTRIDKPL